MAAAIPVAAVATAIHGLVYALFEVEGEGDRLRPLVLQPADRFDDDLLTIGARLTRKRLKALHYPKDVVEDVTQLVRLSGRFKGYADGWSDSAVRRYARDAGSLQRRLRYGDLVIDDELLGDGVKDFPVRRQGGGLQRSG